MKKKVIIVSALIVLAILLAIGIFLIMQKPAANPVSSINNPPGTQNIIISNSAFTPSQLIIGVGNTIVWTNNDPMTHTVTSDSGVELNSPAIASGGTYSHTFGTVGTFNYHCSIHPSMSGEIIVQ